MKISIITVCYNSAATIQDTITSIANQDHPDIEHIVVDGGSKDETLTIVKSASSVTKLISEQDKGIYDAMNKGLNLANGDVIGFLNADDFYADDIVLTQVSIAFQDSSVQACYADLVYVDKSDTSRITRYWKSRPFCAGLFKKGWMPAHPTFFARREVYEQFGNFNLNFPRQADFELTMRFLEIHQIKSVYIPKVWVRMRTGGASNNSIKGIIKGNLEAYRACKMHNLQVGPFFIIKKIFSRIPQFFSKPDFN
ncbi:glycosyltransferase family 2 protein [Methylophilus aquaticus]|uniref:Glycosyltransferase family 2 protein n=1 Tax=Methylophilus aquaticus TaxID=1971610 RepID=A0ABT9JU34_9PROT|nr:glycosyltransferase family 2 protein [Methylophilus aquaticus]MDP8568095.1 glycosyltransferase family 2 protein [Methylophilus aquaticus]